MINSMKNLQTKVKLQKLKHRLKRIGLASNEIKRLISLKGY